MADRRAVIPLDRIDPAPWNPKAPISGEHKAGLAASLDTFGLRDDLKVWPRPDAPGRYYALDGNQRLGLLSSRGVSEVECRVLADLTPEDAKLFTAAFDRNFAFYDRSKLESLADEIKAGREALVETLLRPDSLAVPAPAPALAEEPGGDAGDPMPFVPVVFSLSREGYEAVKGLVASGRSRAKRESRLTEALSSFAESALDDLVVETALRVAASRSEG